MQIEDKVEPQYVVLKEFQMISVKLLATYRNAQCTLECP